MYCGLLIYVRQCDRFGIILDTVVERAIIYPHDLNWKKPINSLKCLCLPSEIENPATFITPSLLLIRFFNYIVSIFVKSDLEGKFSYMKYGRAIYYMIKWLYILIVQYPLDLIKSRLMTQRIWHTFNKVTKDKDNDIVDNVYQVNVRNEPYDDIYDCFKKIKQ